MWALRDVSFEVKQGEILGIIGRNGAGKSTLLKILSRVTAPSSGEIRVKGRIASLLEVGTGFHPELTGRENVFLNGAILGMTKAEIKQKLDEIVAFAEIEKFLDTPVKRYSSGMYVRLAFAVAAHLEPEILIVDEVLAVGDAEFQKKCLGKMSQVAGEGRTILFVSHNMAAVEKLCKTGLVIANGTIAVIETAASAVQTYLDRNGAAGSDTAWLLTEEKRSGTGEVRIRGFRLLNADGLKVEYLPAGAPGILAFQCENRTQADLSDVSIGYSLSTTHGDNLVVQYSDYEDQLFDLLPGTTEVRAYVRSFPLANGSYLVGARVVARGIEIDWPKDSIGRIVIEGGVFAGHATTPHSGRGYLLLENTWLVVPLALKPRSDRTNYASPTS
jgi:lipopolysaccharide transport system ATP-binding protein